MVHRANTNVPSSQQGNHHQPACAGEHREVFVGAGAGTRDGIARVGRRGVVAAQAAQVRGAGKQGLASKEHKDFSKEHKKF